RASHSAASDFLLIVSCCHTYLVKPAIKRFENSFPGYALSAPAGCAVLDIDRGPDRNFVAFTIRLQGVKRRRFHESNHVRSGIHRRDAGGGRAARLAVERPLAC